MLETLLKPNTGASLSGCVRWTQPMDGVRVCDFDCALTVPPALPAEPSEVPCEVLFCRQGGLRLTMTDGRQVFLHEHEVLLLLGASVQSLSVADGLFSGELVLIEQSAAAPCRLTVNAARIKARVTSHLGCVVLRSAVWIDNLAAALQSVPERDRAAYSAIKAIELLYLISTDSPLLAMPPESVSRDHYLTDTVRQVQEYMVSHLSDPLTIDQLSARFRISPTALKDIFRQTYGRPIHQYLLEKRVQHAAELLHRSPLSIVDIAAAVGYNSASQFGVAFKRRYQLTPSQYRRQSRKSEQNATILIIKLKISGNKLQKCPIPCVSCLKLCDKQENL